MEEKPDKEFCRDLGCGAWDYEEEKCGAIKCPYPKELLDNWRKKREAII